PRLFTSIGDAAASSRGPQRSRSEDCLTIATPPPAAFGDLLLRRPFALDAQPSDGSPRRRVRFLPRRPLWLESVPRKCGGSTPLSFFGEAGVPLVPSPPR